jgi:hypothetical protein
VAKIMAKLYNDDDTAISPDSTVFYLFQLSTQWMSQRGLFEAIYGRGYIGAEGTRINSLGVGTDAWIAEYRKFIEWFDGAVTTIQSGVSVVEKLAPELAPFTRLVNSAGDLYSAVRKAFPITPGT